MQKLWGSPYLRVTAGVMQMFHHMNQQKMYYVVVSAGCGTVRGRIKQQQIVNAFEIINKK